MAVLMLASASGSPGVTTAALGLALTWSRPVLLVEADPTGGSAILAGYFRGDAAGVDGLIDVAWAHRDRSLAEALASLSMPVPNTSVSLLTGARGYTQARSLTSLWEPLAVALRGLEQSGQDVIVDAGRLGLANSPEPLIYGADLALLTVRSDLVALSGARSWAETLRSSFHVMGVEQRLGVLLVGEGRPYTSRNVAKVLGVPVTASLAWDERSAAVFSHGNQPGRHFDGAALPRSLRAAQASLESALAVSRESLDEVSVGGGSR